MILDTIRKVTTQGALHARLARIAASWGDQRVCRAQLVASAQAMPPPSPSFASRASFQRQVLAIVSVAATGRIQLEALPCAHRALLATTVRSVDWAHLCAQRASSREEKAWNARGAWLAQCALSILLRPFRAKRAKLVPIPPEIRCCVRSGIIRLKGEQIALYARRECTAYRHLCLRRRALWEHFPSPASRRALPALPDSPVAPHDVSIALLSQDTRDQSPVDQHKRVRAMQPCAGNGAALEHTQWATRAIVLRVRLEWSARMG